MVDALARPSPVLRVTHLDTQELDESLLAQLKHSISHSYFKYMRRADFFQRYQPEIFAALKFALWYHTYHKSEQTVAQSVLDWSYDPRRQTRVKKLLHAGFYCLDEWFEERLLGAAKFLLVFYYDRVHRVEDHVRVEFKRKLDRIFAVLKTALSWASLINYLLFLVNGKYLTLIERILGLEAIYTRPKSIQNLSSEVSQKEVLWQAYFSLFKLADTLFDLNRVYKRFMSKTSGFMSAAAIPATTQSREELIKKCAICGNEPPTMVHCASDYGEQGSCQHVFCYFCIRRALNDSADNCFTCRVCSRPIRDCQMFINNKNI